MRRPQTVCSRDAYDKGWLAARQSRGGNVDVSEARFVRRYGQHKVEQWFAGWQDRTAGRAKWTSLDAHGRVSHTDVTSEGDPPTNTPPENTMPGKRAKGTNVRSVAMPDSLWTRAEKAGAKRGTSASDIIRTATERELERENAGELNPELEPA